MDNQPSIPDPGVVLAEAGRVEEAMAHWRAVLTAKPGDARVHHNLGVALAQSGKLDEAVASLHQAIHFSPGYAEAHFNLGNVLIQTAQTP
jgi:protein O-GlcNAc transferase